MGYRRPQQPHQHLLVERADRLPELDGPRPSVERLRQRRGDLPHLVAPRSRPLLQPARGADHGGAGQGRHGHLCRSTPEQHRSKADHWLPTWPGTEAFLCLSIAHLLLENGTWERDFVRRWVNWETFLAELYPDMPQTFESVEAALKDHYSEYTPEEAERITGVSADEIRQIAPSSASTRPSSRATIGVPPVPATRAAGRSPGRCSSSTCSPARSAPWRHVGQRLEQVRRAPAKGAPPIEKWNEL